MDSLNITYLKELYFYLMFFSIFLNINIINYRELLMSSSKCFLTINLLSRLLDRIFNKNKEF